MRMSAEYLSLIKPLRLITPETAQKFGIPAEAPIWVSPWISAAYDCEHCRCTFTPLVYSPHSTVISQHFHPNSTELDIGSISGRGGIYFSRELSSYHAAWGWVAECEPRGGLASFRDEIMSEGAFVRGIHAFCAFCSAEDVLQNGYSTQVNGEPLQEGLAVNFQSDDPNSSGILSPLCDLRTSVKHCQKLNITELKPHFRFRAMPDGRIVFSNLT